MALDIDILIDDPRWEDLGFEAEFVARRAAQVAFDHAGLPPPFEKNRAMELAVLLTRDDNIQVMNKNFRGKDKPTNVLSFAAIDDPDFRKTAALPGPFYLGDLALALETLQRESLEQDKGFQDHFTHLVVHGTLHLLGYDHQENDAAQAMEALEIKVLNDLGVENPYNNPHFVPD